MNTIVALVLALSPVNNHAVDGSTAVISRQADARAEQLADARVSAALQELSRRRAAPAADADETLAHTAIGNEQVGG